MTSTSVRPSNYNQQSRDPNTAAIMSLILPGLGQMYNGETRKGVLFLLVALLNVLLVLAMAFNMPILEGLLAFGSQFHMKPNRMLLIVLKEAYLGSMVSFILMGFFLSYVLYAVRDAYDHAALKRRRIYPDFVIELPEATSGSYIFHFSIMVALFIVAFFFVIPPMPKKQLTEIEFVDQQMRVKERPKQAKFKAEHNSKDSGKHEPKKAVQPPHPSAQPKSQASQSHAPAQPKQAQPSQAKPTPAPPTPHPAAPTPHPSAPAPHPSPAAPTPTPAAPRPMMPMAHAPAAPSHSPAAPAMPHMPTAAPSAAPMMAPRSMAAPSAVPMPMAPGARSAAPSAMPSLAPSALPKAGGGSGMPTPMARPTGGGGVQGLPTLAPSTIAMGSGGGSGGGMSNFAPLAKHGSSGGGSGFGAPSAPGPINASSGGGGGKGGGGGPVPVAMAGGGGGHGGGHSAGGGAPAPVKAGHGGGGGGWSSGPISITPAVPRGGGGGGDGATGNPNPNNNPGGRPSVAAQADVDFGPYMADLQRRIKRAWFPPRGQESRRVKVIFKVHSGGELSDLRIEVGSGVAIADQAALQAVTNAAPFRPLPAGAPSVVDIEFTFDYNVFSGGRSF